MTGFTLSWRIHNDKPPLEATVTEIGRTVQTPGFYKNVNDDTNQIYTTILVFPQGLQSLLGNGFLSIELQVYVKGEDVEGETVDYSDRSNLKVYKEERKTWEGAEAQCVLDGGHLASILSPEEQDQLEALTPNWPGDYWLGGRRGGGGFGKFEWSDGNHFKYTNI